MLALVLAFTHGLAVSPRVASSFTFEPAKISQLPEVSSFFVDAFWLGSTTFSGIELSPSDRRQLEQKVADDLGPRYGIKAVDERPGAPGQRGAGNRKGFPSKSLFGTKLIVARDAEGTIVGCAGIEAALYEAGQGQVFRSDQADQLLRVELAGMGLEEANAAADAYKEDGIGGLAKGVISKQFTTNLVNPYIEMWKPCSLLANLAVAPAYRRSGLGRALCDECEKCTVDDWKMDEIALQVEEANTAAITLYRKDGYGDVFREAEGRAIRLNPSEDTVFSALPGPFSALAPENKDLLKEVASPTVTMAKPLSEEAKKARMMASMPAMPKFEAPKVPDLPSFEAPKVPELPKVELPSMPKMPEGLPKVPELPKIELPKMPKMPWE